MYVCVCVHLYVKQAGYCVECVVFSHTHFIVPRVRNSRYRDLTNPRVLSHVAMSHVTHKKSVKAHILPRVCAPRHRDHRHL